MLCSEVLNVGNWGDMLKQMEATGTMVCKIHQRIKYNQNQVETLRKSMLSKLQTIDDTFAKVKDKLQEQDEQKREILKLKRQIALNQIESHNLSYQLGNAKTLKPQMMKEAFWRKQRKESRDTCKLETPERQAEHNMKI